MHRKQGLDAPARAGHMEGVFGRGCVGKVLLSSFAFASAAGLGGSVSTWLEVAGPGLALAQTPSEPPPIPGLSGPVGPPPDRGARVHDGFYLRIASGFGVYDERLEADESPAGGSRAARNRGLAALSDLAIGGTVAPGWVLGGRILSLDLVASTLRTSGSGEPLPSELDPGLRSLSVVGPFVDWFPNVRGGFHVQAGLGLATLTPRAFGHAATQRSEYLALGGALLLGAGYDFWIADEWSLGCMSQTGVRVLRGEDDSGVGWLHIVTHSPTLFLTLTYH